MKKIFICSAYRGNIDGNIEKAKEYCRCGANCCKQQFKSAGLYLRFACETLCSRPFSFPIFLMIAWKRNVNSAFIWV